jgi:hypothetical protein
VRRFPALYRMPVVYLAASVVAAALFVFGRAGATRRETEVSSSDGILAVASLRDGMRRAEPTRPVESDAVLRTADGLRRKVVIRKLEVVPRKTPEGEAAGRPLDYFAIRFVYGETRVMLQVGPRSGAPDGWVPRDAVLEWDSRVMARPTPRGSRPPLVIYREENCLAAAVGGRSCPRHRGRCPTVGEESSEGGDDSFLGWPILKTKTVKAADGSVRPIFEVASLVADRAPPASPTPERLGSLEPALKHVYVAFAIDTTASMQATIDAAKTLATDLASEVSKRYSDVTLHLALVEYRDDSPGFGFKARLAAPFTDAPGFRGIIGTLSAAHRGDGSVDEAVFDGVALALPGSPGGIAWPTGRSGELATKLLVLLGDAPDHARDLARAEALAAKAKASGITIAAVALDRPGSLSRDERARFDAQWRTLAEGSYRPADRKNGFTAPVAPLLIRTDQAASLAPSLQALIDDRIERARALAALAAAEAEGKLREYVDSRGLTLKQVAPVLVDLHRGEPDPTSRPDPRSNGRKAPSVRQGWVAERAGAARQVTVEILMSRGELDSLIAELAALQQAASSPTEELGDLLAIGTAAATGETSFLAADRGAQTFADHLRRRRNLPPARPDSLLNRSQTDLLRADALDRAALDARLRDALLGLTRRRDAADWSDPLRTVEGMATVPYDLIDF